MKGRSRRETRSQFSAGTNQPSFLLLASNMFYCDDDEIEWWTNDGDVLKVSVGQKLMHVRRAQAGILRMRVVVAI